MSGFLYLIKNLGVRAKPASGCHRAPDAASSPVVLGSGSSLKIRCSDSSEPPHAITELVKSGYMQVLDRTVDPTGLSDYACSAPAKRGVLNFAPFLQHALLWESLPVP